MNYTKHEKHKLISCQNLNTNTNTNLKLDFVSCRAIDCHPYTKRDYEEIEF